MTTDDDMTIDWSLSRQSDVLRAVILTGPESGLMISGECVEAGADPYCDHSTFASARRSGIVP